MEKQTTYRYEIIGIPRLGQSVKALDLAPGVIAAFLAKGTKEKLEDVKIKSIKVVVVFEGDDVKGHIAAIKAPVFLINHLEKNFDITLTKQKVEGG